MPSFCHPAVYSSLSATNSEFEVYYTGNRSFSVIKGHLLLFKMLSFWYFVILKKKWQSIKYFATTSCQLLAAKIPNRWGGNICIDICFSSCFVTFTQWSLPPPDVCWQPLDKTLQQHFYWICFEKPAVLSFLVPGFVRCDSGAAITLHFGSPFIPSVPRLPLSPPVTQKGLLSVPDGKKWSGFTVSK